MHLGHGTGRHSEKETAMPREDDGKYSHGPTDERAVMVSAMSRPQLITVPWRPGAVIIHTIATAFEREDTPWQRDADTIPIPRPAFIIVKATDVIPGRDYP